MSLVVSSGLPVFHYVAIIDFSGAIASSGAPRYSYLKGRQTGCRVANYADLLTVQADSLWWPGMKRQLWGDGLMFKRAFIGFCVFLLAAFAIVGPLQAAEVTRQVVTTQDGDYFGFDLRTEQNVTLDQCSAVLHRRQILPGLHL